MAKIKDKRSSERTKLEEVIPLSTPFEVQIAVASACNFKCVYCPTWTRKGKGLMTMGLFETIIDDLDDFPDKVKTIRLVREGEPLLNKNFAAMVKYAKSCQPTSIVDTTTNASLLTPELSDAIIEAGLDKIFISLQGITSQAYRALSKYELKFNDLLENILYFCVHRDHTKVYIKVPDIGVTKEETQEFFDIFEPFVDEMFVERIFPAWPNWDVSHLQIDPTIGYYGKPIGEPVKVCTLPFYNLTINHKGIVSACSIDWEEKTNLGDVTKETLYEIWNGQKLRDFQKMQLRGERFQHDLCGKCISLAYCEPDIIDEYAEEVLRRMK